MRRSRQRVPWDAVLAVALVANVVYGIWRSPILCLRRVHVVGADPADHAAIAAAIHEEIGIAALAVPARVLESQIQRLPEVDSAAFSDNVFGSGRLVIRYRTPIARLGRSRLALDAEGRVWKSSRPLGRYPSVGLPASALNPGLALVRSTPLVAMAQLAQRLPEAWPDFKGQIVLDDAGTVCLNRSDSGRVVLGGTDAMDEKLSRLSALLRDHPELFAGAVEVNLTSPTHPVYRHVASGSKTAD